MLERRAAIELVFTVVRHPTRFQILLSCLDAPQSANSMSHHLPASIGAIAYHVRELAAEGYLRQTRTQRVRGATETFFTLTASGRALLAKIGVDHDHDDHDDDQEIPPCRLATSP